MTVNAAEYNEWLASGRSSKAIIEAVEFFHPAWQSLYLVNWNSSLYLTHETGAQHDYLPGRFEYTKPDLTATMEQQTSLRIGSLNGAFYAELRKLTFRQRQTPLTLVHRMYLEGSYDKPLVTPPPKWTVHQISIARETVELSLQATPTRVRRLGEYYTQANFPVLDYV